MVYKDYFSTQARTYAQARPDYPAAMFQLLLSESLVRELAWDCATGNGQAARSLSAGFSRVVASDASSAQIAEAHGPGNISFEVFPAEAPTLEPETVDLLTVAQALHWLNRERFFVAAERVLKPGGLLACWCYELCTISPDIDRMVNRFYEETVGSYWPPERRLVERQYRDIEFPFECLSTPGFEMQKHWQPEQMLAYADSWSATQRYRKAVKQDPIIELARELQTLWPRGEEKLVRWPVTLVVCRK